MLKSASYAAMAFVVLSLNACGKGSVSSSASFGGSAAPADFSPAHLQSIASATHAETQWQATILAVGKLTPDQYFNAFLAGASNDAVNIGGVKITQAKTAVSSRKANISTLKSYGKSMLQIWRLAGFEFKRPTSAELHDDLMAVQAWGNSGSSSSSNNTATATADAGFSHQAAKPGSANAGLGLDDSGQCYNQYLTDDFKQGKCGSNEDFLKCFSAQQVIFTASEAASLGVQGVLGGAAIEGATSGVTSWISQQVVQQGASQGTSAAGGAIAKSAGCSSDAAAQRLQCSYGGNISKAFDCTMDQTAKEDQGQILSSME